MGETKGSRFARAVTTALIALCAMLILALPAGAATRKPVVAYIEDANIKLYDLELGKDLGALPLNPAPDAQSRFAVSFHGRYVLYTDAQKDLHLFNRATRQQVPLPGIDVYNNPGFLGVSETGLLTFDDNANGPTVIYDSRTKEFVDGGLPATDQGHRQPKISGNGRFLATTCGPVDNCAVDLGTDSNPYLQDLGTKTDTGLPDDDDSDEEDPCINFQGDLVGWHAGNPTAADQKDVFLYDRGSGQFLTLPGLNDPTKDETFCTLSPGGTYVGLMHQDDGFKVYDRSTGSFLQLPDEPFSTGAQANQVFSSPIAFCGGLFATAVGTPRRDVFRGTARADVIATVGGNDVIRGLGGNDRLCGGRGRDRLLGGRGRDRLFGGPGRDRLLGGKGRDRLRGGPGRDFQRQ